jgi:hypothetical protein
MVGSAGFQPAVYGLKFIVYSLMMRAGRPRSGTRASRPHHHSSLIINHSSQILNNVKNTYSGSFQVKNRSIFRFKKKALFTFFAISMLKKMI